MKNLDFKHCWLSRGYTRICLLELSNGCLCVMYHLDSYFTTVRYFDSYQTILDSFLSCRYKMFIKD